MMILPGVRPLFMQFKTPVAFFYTLWWLGAPLNAITSGGIGD